MRRSSVNRKYYVARRQLYKCKVRVLTRAANIDSSLMIIYGQQTALPKFIEIMTQNQLS